jgi:isocitrate dehydrogenase kinase/phosphatase
MQRSNIQAEESKQPVNEKKNEEVKDKGVLTSSKVKLVDKEKRQRVMKEMIKTLNEQAERERVAESYVNGLFSKVMPPV